MEKTFRAGLASRVNICYLTFNSLWVDQEVNQCLTGEGGFHNTPMRSLLKLGGSLFLLLMLLGCSRKDEEPLRVIYSGSVMGYLEPCGCSEGRVGGMARLAGAVRDSLKRWQGGALLLDAGNFAEMYSFRDDSKNRALLRAFKLMGYDAINVAAQDLMAGLPALRWAADSLSLPLISANLRSTDGKLIFPAWTLKKVGNRTVGVIGVGAVRPLNLRLAGITSLTYSDPEEAIRKSVAEIESESDFIFLLCDLGARSARQMSITIPGIDVIISCMDLTPAREPRRFGAVCVLGTSRKGKRLTSLVLQRTWQDSLEVHFFSSLLDSTFADDPAAARLLEDYRNNVSRAGFR